MSKYTISKIISFTFVNLLVIGNVAIAKENSNFNSIIDAKIKKNIEASKNEDKAESLASNDNSKQIENKKSNNQNFEREYCMLRILKEKKPITLSMS